MVADIKISSLVKATLKPIVAAIMAMTNLTGGGPQTEEGGGGGGWMRALPFSRHAHTHTPNTFH